MSLIGIGVSPGVAIGPIRRVTKAKVLTAVPATPGQVLEALDSNSRGEKSYKELLELIVGAERTQQLFADALSGNRHPKKAQNV